MTKLTNVKFDVLLNAPMMRSELIIGLISLKTFQSGLNVHSEGSKYELTRGHLDMKKTKGSQCYSGLRTVILSETSSARWEIILLGFNVTISVMFWKGRACTGR